MKPELGLPLSACCLLSSSLALLFSFRSWSFDIATFFALLVDNWALNTSCYQRVSISAPRKTLGMAPSLAERLALPFALIQLLATVFAQTTIQTSTPTFETATDTGASFPITAAPSTSTASATSSASSSSSSSSSRGPQVHTVKVGSGGFKYEPAELRNVSVGDTITFEFYPPDHSVARAEYMSPCVPYEYTGRDKVGFWSGTQFVDTVDEVSFLRCCRCYG